MATKLVKDLHTVAGIVGSLGLSIAEAQREMNRDYLEALERLTALAISLQHKKSAGAGEPAAIAETDREFVKTFLTKFAPTRYQYTQTSLKVRLDLAQTMSAAGSFGGGGSIGAIAVNASASMAYGSDYQAAAECTTQIDAVPPADDLAFLSTLAERAATASAKDLTLPARATVDQKIIDSSQSIITKLLGDAPAPIEDK